MSRIVFQPASPVVRSAPNRADIACFIGFVSPRPGATVPANIADWLGREMLPIRPSAGGLWDVPIPVDDWAVFDRLFAWNQRTTDPNDGATYLGCAVRSFFGQGGRKCYVICMGASFPADTPRTQQTKDNPPSRDDLLGLLVPGYGKDSRHISPADRANWSSVGHLFGLPEVSFICLPDLPDLVCDPPKPMAVISPPPPPEEHFVECSTSMPSAPDETLLTLAAPRCNDEGYARWRNALGSLQNLLVQDPLIHEMQLIASVPIPDDECAAATNLLEYLSLPDPMQVSDVRKATTLQQFLLFPSADPQPRTGAFLQLAYPWLRTMGSAALPGGLEPPDGALAGLLARNALTRGTFTSGTKVPVTNVFDIYPPLRPSETDTPELPPRGDRGLPKRSLVERVSLFAPTPHGMALVSDVTVHPDETFRPAPVNRLVSVIVRAARTLGQDHVFDGNNERTWALVRQHLNELMTNMWGAGALDGDTPRQAFSVVCDRSTMTQNDLDSGRMIASVAFMPAASIETITVLLSLSAGDAGSGVLVGSASAEVA
jgi:uncharacterized protein